MPKNSDISLLWHSFLYDVNRATASLLYLLQGMEAVRASELAPYNGLPPAQKNLCGVLLEGLLRGRTANPVGSFLRSERSA